MSWSWWLTLPASSHIACKTPPSTTLCMLWKCENSLYCLVIGTSLMWTSCPNSLQKSGMTRLQITSTPPCSAEIVSKNQVSISGTLIMMGMMMMTIIDQHIQKPFKTAHEVVMPVLLWFEFVSIWFHLAPHYDKLSESLSKAVISKQTGGSLPSYALTTVMHCLLSKLCCVIVVTCAAY